MKIEEGKYYRTRGGDVVGPMRSTMERCRYPWMTSTKDYWTIEGDFSFYEGEHDLDLISEVYVSDTPPAVKDTEAELRDMIRDPRYWRTREPEFVKRVMEGFLALVGGDMPPADAPAPKTKTLRDEFAGYAIIGLLAAGDCHAFNRDEMAVEAYRQADSMLEARQCWKERRK
jgi:hypothetical protein